MWEVEISFGDPPSYGVKRYDGSDEKERGKIEEQCGSNKETRVRDKQWKVRWLQSMA
jgi:hypothetical protein